MANGNNVTLVGNVTRDPELWLTPSGQAVATFGAMTFNFWLNNFLTYRDRRLKEANKVFWGWVSFIAACSIGAFANVAVATTLHDRGLPTVVAALVGIGIGSVWNYALSSRFVWGRY